MDLLVQTCHRRGALATGGMAALLLPRDKESDLHKTVLHTVTRQDAGTVEPEQISIHDELTTSIPIQVLHASNKMHQIVWHTFLVVRLSNFCPADYVTYL